MDPHEINKPGDIFKYLGEIQSVNVEYPDEFFNTISKAKAKLEKLLPPVCEICGLPASDCDCEDHC